MELIERSGFLSLLQKKLDNVENGEGHCVFVSGEAGIGKTSLVKFFCKEQKGNCNIYQGACDALFTPRPLAPLYDILWQVSNHPWPSSHTIEERTELFAGVIRELTNKRQKSLIIFEDIHWADEATLDFIKFLGRRITQLRCLFLLTYRDDEVHSNHPLRYLMGQLPPDSFSRIRLECLSREAVDKMVCEKGYNGEDVYNVTGGNPFYVNEILASYNRGVPDNIRDSILPAYNRCDDNTRRIWDLLSVIPLSFEVKYLEEFGPLGTDFETCLQLRILIINDGRISFKHELFRRAIESFLSPLKRITLHKWILDRFRDRFEQNQEIERIIHHAKNANEYETVVQYAPVAAARAACLGAHIEASKLYLSAIEYYQGNDKEVLVKFYEWYAYECYLTNQVKEAIIYTGKTLNILKEKEDIEKIGNCLRFLSRLWWLDGNRKNAEKFGDQAIEVLRGQSLSTAMAMAFSNKSQLKMLLDQADEGIAWGQKAIAIAEEIGDQESLSHALNNVGSIQMHNQLSHKKGISNLQQSLEIALKNSFHEHAARAYSNLGSNAVKLKNFETAEKILNEGIKYSEKRDLDSWRSNMLSLKASLKLETGDWDQAYNIAEGQLIYEDQSPVFAIVALTVLATLKMRRGDPDALPLLLKTASRAFETTELQRIIPSQIALLEYEWLTGNTIIKARELDHTMNRIEQSINNIEKNEFAFWLFKARKQHLPLKEVYEGYDTGSTRKVQVAAELWKQIGCPYGQAMVLCEGSENDKRKAIKILHELGAKAVYERMKLEMRTTGIKNIPNGVRKTTKSNPAFLTVREMDVLELLKEGLQNREIGARLFISSKTVDHHISSILFKLDVKSRAKAVNKALREEIIK